MPITAENVSYTYMAGTPFEHQALKDISFTIEDGDFVGIIGHTGSGKSTLIQIISGLLKGYEGKILINGIDYSDKRVKRNELRRQLGVVFQYPEYQLFEETVEKDIAYGPRKMGYSDEELSRSVRAAMEMVGLDYTTYEDKSPFALSGGQKRKVAIAGVLSMNPNILILDEPIAGLDPAGRESFMKLIEGLNHSGKTILMISHNMDNIAEYANRILVLRKGELFAQGTPMDIFYDDGIISGAGLDVPDVVRFAKKLRSAGIDIPDDIIRYDDLMKHLRRNGRKSL